MPTHSSIWARQIWTLFRLWSSRCHGAKTVFRFRWLILWFPGSVLSWKRSGRNELKYSPHRCLDATVQFKWAVCKAVHNEGSVLPVAIGTLSGHTPLGCVSLFARVNTFVQFNRSKKHGQNSSVWSCGQKKFLPVLRYLKKKFHKVLVYIHNASYLPENASQVILSTVRSYTAPVCR